jgi:hypothetical protein
MLNLTKNRLDYAEQLRAPPGYRLDLGIATTYSLDLEALVATSLALNFDHSLEGDLAGEGLALLESLDQLQDKLSIFYQRGQIKAPQQYSRLFTLLEPLLVPTISLGGAKGAFASFHPKMWLLRFRADDKPLRDQFRLIVLSRNISFDRSWDVAITLDGATIKTRGNTDPRLVDFLRRLSPSDVHAERIEDLCGSLANVHWDKLDGFQEWSILPGFAHDERAVGMAPIELDGKIDELLVMSPFVDADPASLLHDLGQRTRGRKTLISRADTLDAIGKQALVGWQVKSLNDDVVHGEERHEQDQPRAQDIHAKFIVAQVNNQAVWHVGSANMTNAAFGNPARGVMPRNRELMLRMVGSNSKVGPAKLLDQWESTGAFLPHSFQASAATAPEADQALRQFIYKLTSLTWRLFAKRTADDMYAIELRVPGLPPLPRGYKAIAGPVCRPSFKTLSEHMTWNDVRLTDISAFVAVEVTTASGTCQRFAVQAVFRADMLDQRKQAVFKETVGSGEKLLRYLNLLLDAGASKTAWQRADKAKSDADIFGLDSQGALYEQLLRAAARAPDRLRRALDVFERLAVADHELPSGLEDMLRGFAHFAGAKQ